MRALPPALLLSLALAATAGAQEAAPVTPAAPPPLETPPATPPSDTGGDPIGDILGALPPDQTTDEDADTRATAATPVSAPPTAAGAPLPMAPALAIAPTPIPPPSVPPQTTRRPALDRPVMIGEAGVTPDGPPTTADLIYESRIRASASSAQGMQGSLDGGWTVRGPDGAPLMALQLVDRGGYGPLEGAWRSLSPTGKVGLIDSLDRQPSVLTVRITRGYGKTAVLSLTPTASGWVGQITDESGSRAVTMQRN